MEKTENYICLFDTSIASLNVGDFIIMDAVKKQLSLIDKLPQLVSLPTHDNFGKEGRKIMSTAEFSLVGGTNLLSSELLKYRQWKFKFTDLAYMRNCILMGVGWWQYQNKPDLISEVIWKRILHKEMIHSVRDSFTQNQLKSIGVTNVINTGCPTMWQLTPEHCSTISEGIGKRVVFTLTDYNQDLIADGNLITSLKQNYEEVVFWPQGSEDIYYFNKFEEKIRANILILPPQLSALDEHLCLENTDYIGTRLHAGIRALQHKVRTLIIGIDNRAIEKSKDFNLPVLARKDIDNINKKINEKCGIEINMPWENINAWKSQFTK